MMEVLTCSSRAAGSRHSPLSGGPRLAITPVHAILNYCFALLESETRLALAAVGLDPILGLGLHTDTPNRDSLALDVLEPVRVEIERWLLNWITRESLRRADFFETATGNCRLMSHLCAKLSETAPMWGKLVAPSAEYVARTLWASTFPAKSERRLSTPLTQQHRRVAKGRPSFPEVTVPKPERRCRGCGKPIPRNGSHAHCTKCWEEVTADNFRTGRNLAHTPEARARRAETQRKQQAANRSFDPSSLPAWLTRDFYRERISPLIANISKPRIREAIGVSEPHAVRIAKGLVPAPRHWLTLARLAGIQMNCK
jgi:hypothetical protein